MKIKFFLTLDENSYENPIGTYQKHPGLEIEPKRHKLYLYKDHATNHRNINQAANLNNGSRFNREFMYLEDVECVGK